MGFFKKKAPAPTRDAAAQWRINRTRRQSFAPAYFAKQAFLFISLTILVFFVDIALYIVFQFAIYNNPDYDGSPTSTTFEVTDNLSLARDNAVRIARECRENIALFHGERYALAVWANRFCIREVKRARCELKRVGLGGITATKHGAYTQHEFLRRKRLWNVVVGARAQSRESIFGLVFRRKEHHGQGRACGKRPQVFAQRKAVAIG